MLTIVVAFVLVVLLVVEWTRRLSAARVVAALFGLVVLYAAQPGPWRAARRALSLPAAERTTTWEHSEKVVPAYESGVLTMHRAMVDDIMIGFPARMFALGALAWLAISPVLRGSIPGRPEARVPGGDTVPDSVPPAPTA
jgi:hypothetical protein